MRLKRALRPLHLAATAILLATGVASAQDNPIAVTLKAADTAAGKSAERGVTHPLPLAGVNRQEVWSAGRPASFPKPENIPGLPTPGFFPGDVTDTLSGVTVASAQTHGVYVNCLPNCWGTPSRFLGDLFQSDFIHVADQYTGGFGQSRYSVGSGAVLTAALPPVLFDGDILAIAHAAAAALKASGYQHVFHIFLPAGQDVCITGTTECYSPDNPATFFFCAYHSSATFSDIGHVLVSVEPYQNVPGCSVSQPSPNGPIVDSTANTLSHEMFETVTDPDGKTWWNNYDLALYGSEIADECAQAYFNYKPVTLNEHAYEIQPVYSNLFHACAYSPYLGPF